MEAKVREMTEFYADAFELAKHIERLQKEEVPFNVVGVKCHGASGAVITWDESKRQEYYDKLEDLENEKEA